MAKTTKKNTRSSKPSRAPRSAKSSNKKGVLSKINWGSKKVQLVLVVLVFGIVGGSYLVYKSRAASTVGQAYLSHLRAGSSVNGTVHQITEKHHKSSKKNLPILAMNHNARITSGTVAMINKPGTYRACIVGALTAGAVRQPDVGLIIDGKSRGSLSQDGKGSENKLPTHYTYGPRCSGWNTYGKGAPMPAAAKVRINNYTGKVLYVGVVMIQKL